MAKLDEKIGFVGGGNMAFAIGAGLINKCVVKSSQILVSGPNLDNLERWRDIGVNTTNDNGETVSKSDIIFLCVKPHMLEIVAKQIETTYNSTSKDKDKIFVSVLAGIDLETLQNAFNFITGFKIIRTMPNTSIQVGEGCTVYCPGSNVLHQDIEKIHLMFNLLGMAKMVSENMIISVGSLTGCGPAFVYTIIEALADGAVKQGVPRKIAIELASQMIYGASKTVLETGKHPAVLRDEVCSPGGSTICGVHELEKGGLRSTLINAIEAASKKSKELGIKTKTN